MKKEWLQMVENLKKPSLYFGLELEMDTSPNISSHVGGKPYLQKGEKYPVCPRCKEKENFVLQIHVPKANMLGYNLYVLYYCFSCSPTKGEQGFTVRNYENPHMMDSKETKILDYFPYASLYFEPIWSLPDWNTLQLNHHSLFKSLHQNKKEDAWDNYDELKSKVLGIDGYESLSFYKGHPQFVEEAYFPTCPCCENQMKLWIQLDTCDEIDLVWSGGGCMYIFKCPQDSENYSMIIQNY